MGSILFSVYVSLLAIWSIVAGPFVMEVIGRSVKLTIGSDANTARDIQVMGGQHIVCPVDEFVVDEKNKIVSTPAYMLGPQIKDVAVVIEKLVNKILTMI